MATTLDTSIAKTTLAAVKRQANIVSSDAAYDDSITEYINVVSQRITTLLDGRELVANEYVQWVDGLGEDVLSLPQYPLQRVNLLASGRDPSMTIRYTGSGVRATAQVTSTALRLTSWGTGGVTATDVAWADYETVGEVVSYVNASVTDWTATLVTDNPSKWMRPLGGRDAKTAAIDIDGPNTFDTQYEIKRDTGMILFPFGGQDVDYFEPVSGQRPTNGMGLGGNYLGGASPFGGLSVLVDYRAGFETVPADIEQVAREMAVMAFDGSYRDGSVKSESLGGYSYTLVDQAVESGRFDAVLNRYRREVMA
jgi:hypothetical protein